MSLLGKILPSTIDAKVVGALTVNRVEVVIVDPAVTEAERREERASLN